MNENISQKSERHPAVYYRAKAGSEQVSISYEEWARGQGALSWDTEELGGCYLTRVAFQGHGV